MNRNTFSESEIPKNAKQSRDVVGEAIAQLEKIKTVGMSVRDEVESYVARQPLAAVGIAAGAGFVLGSVFGSRLGRLALMAAVGYAAQEVIEGAFGEGGVRKLVADEISKLAKNADEPS
jgi:hypothetical protein